MAKEYCSKCNGRGYIYDGNEDKKCELCDATGYITKSSVKCKQCNSEELLVRGELNKDTDPDVFDEVVECNKCHTLHRVYYKLFKIVRLNEGD